MFRHGKVDRYIDKADDWAKPMLEKLRGVLLQTGLEETVKWGAPTYIGKKNVVSFLAFKNHVALWFYHGALLSDPDKVLIRAQKSTQGLLQWRFRKLDEIDADKVRKYVDEAKQNDREERFVKPKKKPVPPLPEVFKNALENEGLLEKFKAMAPSHRREHIEHIIDAKKQETRDRRLKKALELIAKAPNKKK